MNLPDQPSTFRHPSAAERPWWWRLEDKAGAEVPVSDDLAGQRFTSQADAESWVGEIWSDLAERGCRPGDPAGARPGRLRPDVAARVATAMGRRAIARGHGSEHVVT